MNIIHSPMQSASNPTYAWFATRLLLPVAVVTQKYLAVTDARHPSFRSLFTRILQSDYWIRRARRRHIMYRMLSLR